MGLLNCGLTGCVSIGTKATKETRVSRIRKEKVHVQMQTCGNKLPTGVYKFKREIAHAEVCREI